MQHARSTNRYAHTRLSSQISISSGSINRCLFIPETYEPYAKIHRLLGNINDWKARKAEDDLHVEVDERLGDQFCAVYHDCGMQQGKEIPRLNDVDVASIRSNDGLFVSLSSSFDGESTEADRFEMCQGTGPIGLGLGRLYPFFSQIYSPHITSARSKHKRMELVMALADIHQV